MTGNEKRNCPSSELHSSEKLSNPMADGIRLASRQFQPENTVVRVGPVYIGSGEPIIIAGPCAVESLEQVLETAWAVKEAGAHILRGGAFKPRTSPYDFQGLGVKGLEFLARAREDTGLPIVTEVMEPEKVPLVAEFADMLQIGSRNMYNYPLLRAVGQQSKPVLLKRGMSATLYEFLMSAEYILQEGNSNVVLCERGIRCFSDYTRNTLDLAIIPAVKHTSHLPIIVDPSHGTGRPEYIEPMSLAALAAGADGIMVEVHTRPHRALSDAEQALSPEQFRQMMKRIESFLQWQRNYGSIYFEHQ